MSEKLTHIVDGKTLNGTLNGNENNFKIVERKSVSISNLPDLRHIET